jgi:AcrR family transcriptional regulator
VARKFVEPDKNKLKERILEQGRALFITYGFKKTSVADITKAVGISQGSFYLFYPSKEELYADILMREEQQIRDTLISRYWTEGRITRKGLADSLAFSVHVLEGNVLLRQLYDQEVMQQLFRKLPESKQEEMFRQDADDLLPYIKNAQECGLMHPYPPETVVSLMRAFVLMAFHKEQIGAAHYGETIRLMADLLSKSLILETGNTE